MEVVVCVIRRAESIGEGQQGRSGNVWVLVLVYDYGDFKFCFRVELACMHAYKVL